MPDPDQLVEQPFGAVGAIAVANLTTSHHLFAIPRRAPSRGFVRTQIRVAPSR
jgi:hypothetical protein